ncbi:hypothetical protein GCM10025734_16450 [Kitasatospora paranensis]
MGPPGIEGRAGPPEGAPPGAGSPDGVPLRRTDAVVRPVVIDVAPPSLMLRQVVVSASNL